jgi:hypothetical protein
MLQAGATSYTADTSGAAAYASNLSNGNCTDAVADDWFLGSVGEMRLLFSNIVGLGGFAEKKYWTSNQASLAIEAWCVDANTGTPDIKKKDSANNENIFVRPIRQF